MCSARDAFQDSVLGLQIWVSPINGYVIRRSDRQSVVFKNVRRPSASKDLTYVLLAES